MVGVAGKSHACNTCKKRRVKCDFGRPSCLRCISANKSCGGYSRDIVFVNRTPSRPSTTATAVLSHIKAQAQLEDAENKAFSWALADRKRSELELRRLFSQPSQHSHEFRKFAVGFLQVTYLPQPPTSGEGTVSWVHRLADLVEPSQSLNTALFAFCLAQLHVTNPASDDSPTLYQCLDHYSTALQHLHSDLDDAQKRFREETLAAIAILSTCELFLSPEEYGWTVHSRGIAEILRLRDPEMAKTPIWRHLFSRLRIVCTITGLSKRQAQLLQSDVWRQIVTESSSDHENALDQVFLLIGDAPGFFEKAINLVDVSDHSLLLHKAAILVQSMLSMARKIENWQEEYRRASPTPRFWSIPSLATNPTDLEDDHVTKLFPFCFEFQSLGAALSLTMCWGVVAQLYSNIIQIHDLVRSRLDRPGKEVEDLLIHPADGETIESISHAGERECEPETSAWRQTRSLAYIQSEGTRMARYLCQTMEYIHRVEMGTFGGHATAYPTWSARQYFLLHPGHERESKWLENIHKMEGPGTHWGLCKLKFADIVEPLAAMGRAGDYSFSA
ncbi:hypothetical protein BX600DRAFT_158272 [Xylariales sp. PMI_506]|nr:hypothetical protein BX600DRAFT_158272 [Xylariales sp. PMI_506]